MSFDSFSEINQVERMKKEVKAEARKSGNDSYRKLTTWPQQQTRDKYLDLQGFQERIWNLQARENAQK
jgi:hypothetical protein